MKPTILSQYVARIEELESQVEEMQKGLEDLGNEIFYQMGVVGEFAKVIERIAAETTDSTTAAYAKKAWKKAYQEQRIREGVKNEQSN